MCWLKHQTLAAFFQFTCFKQRLVDGHWRLWPELFIFLLVSVSYRGYYQTVADGFFFLTDGRAKQMDWSHYRSVIKLSKGSCNAPKSSVSKMTDCWNRLGRSVVNKIRLNQRKLRNKGREKTWRRRRSVDKFMGRSGSELSWFPARPLLLRFYPHTQWDSLRTWRYMHKHTDTFNSAPVRTPWGASSLCLVTRSTKKLEHENETTSVRVGLCLICTFVCRIQVSFTSLW